VELAESQLLDEFLRRLAAVAIEERVARGEGLQRDLFGMAVEGPTEVAELVEAPEEPAQGTKMMEVAPVP
jgi:hypothetical protein